MVNVNTVYQTVLQILNKEQRGYITPAEFNNLAQQVQLEIFESYFPDGNQLNRQNQNNTQNNTEFFNIFKNQEEKLFPFIKELSFSYDATSDGWGYSYDTASGAATGEVRFKIYYMGEILSSYSSSSTPASSYGSSASSSGGDYITQLTSKSDYSKIIRSKLTAPTEKYPLAYVTSNLIQPIQSTFLKINPTPTAVKVNCVVLPPTPRWSFIQGIQGQYVFSSNGSTDFYLVEQEQTNLIINILKYAGIIINDPTIIDVAAQEAAQVEANEKS